MGDMSLDFEDVMILSSKVNKRKTVKRLRMKTRL